MMTITMTIIMAVRFSYILFRNQICPHKACLAGGGGQGNIVTYAGGEAVTDPFGNPEFYEGGEPVFATWQDRLDGNDSGEHANALFDGLRTFEDWGVSDLDAYTWFMTDVEWSWMSGRTPIEDW